ncbi:MAG: helix-turn-helix domain-containing protein [Chloroflexi bacterium]|nr:helix-turn-helix domain-containing protein [Chloroflexota bacterium]
MKPTTRLRILAHFRKHQTASVRELSRFLGMTGANIRHHLAVLESNDLIEIVGQRKEGRGRPLHVYGLSRRVLGDGLDKLAGTLLDIWLGGAADERQEAGLRSVAEQLAGVTDVKVPVMKRLARAVERLNELHYQARWEASAAGPRLILGHCPYVAIVADHPELCRMDAFLLETRLGSSVEQTAKLQLSDKGLPFCAFLMVGN